LLDVVNYYRKYMKNILQIILAASLLSLGPVLLHSSDISSFMVSDPADPLPRDDMIPVIEMIINGEYEGAERLIQNFAPHDSLTQGFMRISLMHALMGELEAIERSDDFLETAEWIIRTARRRIEINPADMEARFYLGSVREYQAVYYSREKRYLKAIMTARSGFKDLEICLALNDNFSEAHIAAGSYQYWRSAKNFLRFLPGIKDEREDAIRKIRKHLIPGTASYALGLNQLTWIFIDAGDMIMAEKTVHEGLSKYPESRFFLYPCGVIALRTGEWQKAVLYFNKVAESLSDGCLNDRYMWVKVMLYQAECLYHAGRYEDSLRICKEMLLADVRPQDRERCRPLVMRGEKLEKMCLDLQEK